MSSTSSNTQEFSYDELMACYIKSIKLLCNCYARINKLQAYVTELEKHGEQLTNYWEETLSYEITEKLRKGEGTYIPTQEPSKENEK